MSRGGRGGGRGGRGGGRGGRPNVPWDTADEPDSRPSELFPAYSVPTPRQLTSAEAASVHHFLLLRRQIHADPLYTSRRCSASDDFAPRKTYGQAQANALYGVKSRASVDPFTAVPTYSQRFARPERGLPNWSQRPLCRELFPAELLDTVDPDRDGRTKRRKLELSSVSALPSAEDLFGLPQAQPGPGPGLRPEDREKTLLDKLDEMRGGGGGGDDDEDDDGAPVNVDDDEGPGDEEDEDEVYDDEDAGDYDAENYFDNGDDMGDDMGDGDEGDGTY